jgi:hypothetical protein
MAAPVRYPSGVTNVDAYDPMSAFPALDPSKLVTYYNDFHIYTAGDWTVTETAAGATQAIVAGKGGILALTHDAGGGATDVVQLQNPQETFKIVSGKKLWIKARFAATAETISNFGVLVGLAITDTSAVVGVTDGFYFRMATGASGALTMVLEKDSTESSVTVGTLTTATYVEVGAYYNGKDAVEVWLNGAKVGTHTTLTNLCDDEELSVTIASVNATGAAANVLSVDYILVATER